MDRKTGALTPHVGGAGGANSDCLNRVLQQFDIDAKEFTATFDAAADTITIAAGDDAVAAVLHNCGAVTDSTTGVVTVPLVRRRQTTTEYFRAREARAAAAEQLSAAAQGSGAPIKIVNFQVG